MNKRYLVVISVLAGVGLLVVIALFFRGGTVPPRRSVPSSGGISSVQKEPLESGGVRVDSNGRILQKGAGYAVVNGENITEKDAVFPPEAIPAAPRQGQYPVSDSASALSRSPRTLRTVPSSLIPVVSVEAIQSFSVFNVSPQLKSFREQMVKEGIIKTDEFVKINNNTDMEQFLLKLIAWKGKNAGATDVQIQSSLASISKGFSELRPAK